MVTQKHKPLATILLTSQLAANGVKPLKAVEFWSLGERCEAPGYPGCFLGRTEKDLTGYGLSEEMAGRVVRLLDRAVAMAFNLEQLDREGVSTVTPFDSGYPSRLVDVLGHDAPAVLHTAGSLDILRRPGLGVVGSRAVSDAGADAARRLGAQAARIGMPVVSGLARGVDRAAMNGAVEAGGAAVGIPAYSMMRTLRQPGVRRVIREGTALICTPYTPDASFSAWRALGRNKLIYGLAEFTVVVASDAGGGGTWRGATEALEKGYNRVFVWRGFGAGAGNRLLESRGAAPISEVDDIETILKGGYRADSCRVSHQGELL